MKTTGHHKRDYRIDFFRGLALLVMALDHAEELAGTQVISYLTYAPIGVSTAAEVFIFLSGFTLGFAYESVYLRLGYPLLHARCLNRAWQLYVMHIVCLVLTVATTTWIAKSFDSNNTPVDLTGPIYTSNSMLLRFATLQANPMYFDILPLYIIFLCFLPPFFCFLNRWSLVGIGLSATVYFTIQILVLAGGMEYIPFRTTMYYNPIAWQFLFVIGMALGIRKRLQGLSFRLPVRWMLLAIVVLVVVAFWYKGVRLNVLMGWFNTESYTHGVAIPYDLPFIDKSTLGVLRLLHFLLLALVVTQLLPNDLGFWQSWIAHPVIVCGRNALEVFVVGVILNYIVASLMQRTGGGRLAMVSYDFATIAASLAIAYMVDWRKSEPWSVKS